MARGEPLSSILQKAWYEAGRVDSPQQNTSDYNHFVHLINRHQRLINGMRTWRFRRVVIAKTLGVGQRFYDFPDEVDRDRILSVSRLLDGVQPVGLARGIEVSHYWRHNSLVGDRADPPQRWELVDTDNFTQFEIWPLPASGGYSLVIEAMRVLKPLVDPQDVSAFDGDMLALFVAAEDLGDNKGPAKAALAQRMLDNLIAGDNAAPEPFAVGGSAPRPSGIRIDYIPDRG